MNRIAIGRWNIVMAATTVAVVGNSETRLAGLFDRRCSELSAGNALHVMPTACIAHVRGRTSVTVEAVEHLLDIRTVTV